MPVRGRSRLSAEALGGALLLAATVAAVLWANSPWARAYRRLSAARVGPSAWGLDLTLGAWASEGVLCLFFFVVGLELVREATAGSLRDPRSAGAPVAAAVGGMAVPALVYLIAVHARGAGALAHGWAIPTATDVAFAVAVLSVFGAGLPSGLRTFLLTLAVADDLLAVVVIAVFYSDDIGLPALGLAVLAIGAFGAVGRARWARWWLLAPLALAAWAAMHASGVHATIAAAALGLATPARALRGERTSRAERWSRMLSPWSAMVAAPVFAFFAAGVGLRGSVGAALSDPVFVAVAGGLVLGKPIGVLGSTALLTRFTPLRLPNGVGMRDLVPVGLLTGIGFTVALLVASLAFCGAVEVEAAKAGILIGSAISAALGAALLRWDVRRARGADMNRDGIPDRPQPPIGV